MELDVNGSAGWLESEELDVLLLPLLVAMQRKLPTEVLCTDEAACAQRCAKAFLAVKVHPTQQCCTTIAVSTMHGTGSHLSGQRMQGHMMLLPARPEGRCGQDKPYVRRSLGICHTCAGV